MKPPCLVSAFVGNFFDSVASNRGTQEDGNHWARYWNKLESVQQTACSRASCGQNMASSFGTGPGERKVRQI